MEAYLSQRQLRARAIPRSAILRMNVWTGCGVALVEYEHTAGTPNVQPYIGWIELDGGHIVGYSCTCPDAQSRGSKGEPCKHAHHVCEEYLEPSVAIGIPVQLPARAVRVATGG